MIDYCPNTVHSETLKNAQLLCILPNTHAIDYTLRPAAHECVASCLSAKCTATDVRPKVSEVSSLAHSSSCSVFQIVGSGTRAGFADVAAVTLLVNEGRMRSGAEEGWWRGRTDLAEATGAVQ